MMDFTQEDNVTLEQLFFSLTKRKESTVVYISIDNIIKAKDILDKLRSLLSEYKFCTVDFSNVKIVSLYKALLEKLPSIVTSSVAVTYIVNVFGLEYSLLNVSDGLLKSTLLTEQLNYERELLFRDCNYITIIWGPESFIRTLRKEAQDLSSWVVYQFKFQGTAASIENWDYHQILIDLNFFPSKINPLFEENVNQLEYNIKESLSIGNYQEVDNLKMQLSQILMQHLNLRGAFDVMFDGNNLSEKQIKSRSYNSTALTLCVLLDEKDIANELLSAIAKENALGRYGVLLHYLGFKSTSLGILTNQLDSETVTYESANQRITALYNLGMLYLKSEYLDNALKCLQRAQLLQQYYKINSRNILSAIGLLYYKQNNLKGAIELYENSLLHANSQSNIYEYGVTLLRLAHTYFVRGNYDECLIRTQEAIHWCGKEAHVFFLGEAYFDIYRILKPSVAPSKALHYCQLAVSELRKFNFKNEAIIREFYKVNIDK